MSQSEPEMGKKTEECKEEPPLDLCKAVSSDLDKIISCTRRVFQMLYPPRRLWDEYFASNSNRTWVLCSAMDPDVIMGYVMAAPSLVMFLAIDEAYRRKGYGQALMRQVFDDPTTVYPLSLEVQVGNVRAQAFYERLGFTQESRIKDYYDFLDGLVEDAYVMVHRGDSL